MKFLITMNMPSAQGYLVHQVTVEHFATSCTELCDVLNEDEFIIARQWYRRVQGGEVVWVDRGDIVLNTAHIGKIQEWVEYERNEDEAYGNPDERRYDPQGTRPPIRPRRGMF